jgi:hypothetical protein
MANGLPFVFDSFKLDGRMVSQDDVVPLLEGKPINLEPGFAPRDEPNVSPLVLDVMTYDLG